MKQLDSAYHQPQNAGNCIILAVCLLLLSWHGMQAVHELGHVLGAWATGGSVVYVDLCPWRTSHTFVQPNPHPLPVIALGPVVGVLFPLFMWGLSSLFYRSCSRYMRFFTGFCLVANGLYLGSVAIESVGDARDLVQRGIAPWMLVTFAVVTVPIGFLLWNGQGKDFGLGPEAKPVSRRTAFAALGLLLTTWAIQISLCA